MNKTYNLNEYFIIRTSKKYSVVKNQLGTQLKRRTTTQKSLKYNLQIKFYKRLRIVYFWDSIKRYFAAFFLDLFCF